MQKSRKGCIIAIIKRTKSETVIEYLFKISGKLRKQVKEFTLDLAGSMKLIAKRVFPNVVQVIDRFHVQKLAKKGFPVFTNGRKFACYLDVAPFEHTSGKSTEAKTRVSYLAAKKMKSLMHMVLITAIKHDPELK